MAHHRASFSRKKKQFGLQREIQEYAYRVADLLEDRESITAYV